MYKRNNKHQAHNYEAPVEQIAARRRAGHPRCRGLLALGRDALGNVVAGALDGLHLGSDVLGNVGAGPLHGLQDTRQVWVVIVLSKLFGLPFYFWSFLFWTMFV